MRRREFLLGLATMAPMSVQAADASDPKSVVETIYRIAAGPKGDYQGKGALDSSANRKRWFTSALYASYEAGLRKQKKAKEPSPAFDMDPVTASQDPSVRNLAISVQKQDATSATVVAKFFQADAKSPTSVFYIFKREGVDWKIDDIEIPDPQYPFRLSKALKQ